MDLLGTSRRLVRGCAVALSVLFSVVHLHAQGFGEYELKAAFLYNFTTFVEWPADAREEPFVISILGDDPFGSAIDELVAGEAVQGRPLLVQRAARAEECFDSQIVFISASHASELSRLLAALANRPILTVSDVGGFANRGGMVEFVNDGSRIRLRIDTAAVARAGLAVSSKLLRLAQVVER